MRSTSPRSLAIVLWLSAGGLFAQGTGPVSSVGGPLPCDPAPLGRVVSLGNATPGTNGAPELAMVGLPIVGLPFRLEVRNGLPWAPGYLLFGLGQAAIPLPGLGAVLYPNALTDPLLFRVGPDGVSGPLLARDPVSTATCGLPLVAQGFVLDAVAQGGVAVTKAAEIRFGLDRGRTLFPAGGGATPGFFPRDLVAGDFDGDGRDDVAAVSDESPNDYFSVYRNEGRGRFRSIPPPSSVQGVVQAVAGDIDGDGILDLVVGRRSPSVTLTVLFGEGDATFTAGPDTASAYPTDVDLADVNGDGFLDVGVTTAVPDQIEVLLGAGDGTFASSTVRTDGLNAARGLFADLDADGLQDYVVGNFGFVSRFLGQGDGTFGPVLHQTADSAYRIDAGDFDEDGFVDVVTLQDLILSTGNGGFAAPISLGGTLLLGPIAVDLDADGSLDLVTRTEMLPGNGDGSFQPPRPFAAGARASQEVAAGDFEGNGSTGLAVGGSHFFAVHFAAGDGDLLSPFALELGIAPLSNVYAVAIADLDGDPFADVVAGTGDGSDMYVARGKGDGTLEDPLRLPGGTISPFGNYVSSIQVADLDDDGVNDILASVHGDVQGVQVRYGSGGGSFGPYEQLSPGRSRAVAARDLDGDGVLDVLSTNALAHTVDVLLGTGAGSFAPVVSYPCGMEPEGLAVGDVDGDGKADVVTANRGSGDATLLLGAGDGTFGSRTDLPAVDEPYSVGIGDLDGDGVMDLLIGDYDEDSSFLRGLGGGSFAPLVAVPSLGKLVWSIRFADVTGDGIEDALAGTFGHVAVLSLAEDGSFAIATYGTAVGATALAVGDLNGDLVPDLVSGGASTSIGVLIQQDLDHED